MANNINLAKVYVPLLDEVYKNEAKSTILNSNESLIRAGANAKEIIYPQITTSGLGDYDRNSGYTDGSVSVEWKTATFNYDRGQKFLVDSMDDQETFHIAFGSLTSDFMRTKVAPEADAFTFATLAGKEGISIANEAGVSYANAEEFLAALIVATTKMDEDEVPEENRILFATPALINGIMALDTTKSREVLAKFASIVKVPQNRFYTAIDLQDGKSSGEEAGHYKKAADGKDINFMIVHKPCVIKGDKHVVGNLIGPDVNTTHDGYISKYRKYGIVDVLNNKVAGIYVSYKA